jgi:hypothetical protein
MTRAPIQSIGWARCFLEGPEWSSVVPDSGETAKRRGGAHNISVIADRLGSTGNLKARHDGRVARALYLSHC